jgi:putative Mg2+ transporter-C (MgtC) family protein
VVSSDSIFVALETKNFLVIVIRLVIAMLAGGILGVPFAERPGGIRTHALVTSATALFCLLGMELAARLSADISRIIQGVIQGVGFIGAATVIKQGEYIVGINTGSSILVAAGIGCFIGTGYPLVGLALAALLMALNFAVREIEMHMVRERERHRAIKEHLERRRSRN